jgi:nitrogen fixation protein FixH
MSAGAAGARHRMSLWQRFKKPNVWIPSAFVAFFLVVFLANGIMIWSALGSWRGLQTESPWAEEAAYKGVIDDDAAKNAAEWTIGLDVASDGARRADVSVTLRGPEGEPVEANSVQVGFIRPTDDGYDRTAKLIPQGRGVYAASVDLPLAGLWEVRVAAERGEEAVHTSKRVTLQP